MSTINPTVLSAYNAAAQDLFTIEDLDGVSRFVAGSSQEIVSFNTVESNIDTDASFDEEVPGGILFGAVSTLTTYLITVFLDNTSQAPSSFALYTLGTFGSIRRAAGQTLTATVGPFAEETVIQVVAYTDDETLFQYPSQIRNASIVVQAISGYENV
jgi:hypothetical protein